MSFLKIKTPIKTWPLPTENHHHSFWQYVSPDPTPIRKKRNEGNIRLCICNHLYMIVFCCLFQKLAPQLHCDQFLAMSTLMRSRCRSTALLAVFCAAWTLSSRALLRGQLFAMPTGGADGEVQERIGRWGWVKIWGQHIDDELDQCIITIIFNFCAYIYIYIIIYYLYKHIIIQTPAARKLGH